MASDLDRLLARALQQGPQNTITPQPQTLMDTAAMGLSPVPVAGDLAGLLADSASMVKNPSWGNALAMSLGVIPGIPGGSAKRMANKIKAVYKTDPVGGYKTLEKGKTLKNLPEVPEGHTRLFRAQGGKYSPEDVWKPGVIEEANPNKIPGKFFTDDIEYADYYRETYGRG